MAAFKKRPFEWSKYEFSPILLVGLQLHQEFFWTSQSFNGLW